MTLGDGMTTVKFMQSELKKQQLNYRVLVINDAPEEDVEFAKMKLLCCRDVCKVLKEVVEKCQS